MKTLTEFSGVVLRTAHKARAQQTEAGIEKDKLAEAVGEAIGVTGDRLERLFEIISRSSGVRTSNSKSPMRPR